MAHDVFISHAHKDKSVAGALCRKLESAGVRCWIPERDISAGEDWTEATRNAIASSRAMLLLLSENANAALHIQREIAHAFYTKRIIIPLRLTNALPRRDFLFYLGNVRWFDAFSTPAEEHLEALTASINELVPGRTVPRDPMSPHDRIETRTALDISNSRIGVLRGSHDGSLQMLKPVAVAASLLAVGLLWWFVPWQTKHGASLAGGNLRSMYSGPKASPDSLPQATGDALQSTPAYTYSRFGLWVASNSPPTRSVQQGTQDMPSSTPDTPSAGGSPSPPSNDDQKQVGAGESLRAQDTASVTSMQEGAAQVSIRQRGHQRKLHSKSHNRIISASAGLRFADIKSRVRALWHHIVARSK